MLLVLPVTLPASAHPTSTPTSAAVDPAYPRHSSDGLPGTTVLPGNGRVVPVISNEFSQEIAPGLSYRRWDTTDARGRFRAHLLVGDLAEATLGVRYVGAGKVRHRAPVRRLLTRNNAIAGVNGDFFDIGELGAPLGLGVHRGTLRHGHLRPHAAFVVGRGGKPRIGSISVVTRIREFPELTITSVNSPVVDRHGIGLYTPLWGRTAGAKVIRGSANRREVVIRGGRVVANRKRLSNRMRIHGRVLIGKGRGARQLAALKVGTRVTVRARPAGKPQVVLSSNRILVSDGALTGLNDTELHPRTAVGVNGDTVMLLVVDGRSEYSRGLTMRELGQLLRDLGATDALNLDGGGSSTLVARTPAGRLRVRNDPSDGQQRRVPNGLGFVSRG